MTETEPNSPPPGDPPEDAFGDLAREDLLPAVYSELKRLAQRYLGGQRGGHTLQPTALVHEAFVKLQSDGSVTPNDREHFLALCARSMRLILTDHARRRGALKRGGDRDRITLAGVGSEAHDESQGIDLLALQDALQELEGAEPRHARIVELRFFCGLSVEEVAKVLDCSRSTIEAQWRVIRARLIRRLGSGDSL